MGKSAAAFKNGWLTEGIGIDATVWVGAIRKVCNTCISADSHGNSIVLPGAPAVLLQLRNKAKGIAKGFIAVGSACCRMSKSTHC